MGASQTIDSAQGRAAAEACPPALASRRHWRVLIGAVLLLMAAAFVAPAIAPAPGLMENRVLAAVPAWPPGVDGAEAFRGFRKQVEAFVADRFPARPHLISLLNRLRMTAGVSGAESVLVGREGWLFWDDGSHLGAARGDPPMDRAAARLWLERLAGRTEALKARGIPYLVVVGPTKETVYPEHAPAWFGRPSPARATLILPALARAAGAGEVVYLHPAVAAVARRGLPAFSRHDTHWTGHGAYAAYALLIGRLHALGVTGAPLPASTFPMAPDRTAGPNDLASMLGVAGLVRIDFPHITNPAGERRARISSLGDKTGLYAPQVVETGNAGKPVLLMTRDSFSLELAPLLYPHFSRIILAHNDDGFWRPDLIDRFHPDVVVTETVEHGLAKAMDAGPHPSAASVVRILAALDRTPQLRTRRPQFAAPGRRLLRAMAAGRAAEHCSLDIQTLTLTADGQASVTAVGWIAEPGPSAGSPSGHLRLTGQGVDLVAPLRVDASRPDVAVALDRASAEKSGFGAEADVARLPPGEYRLVAYRQARGGGLISCPAPAPLSARR